MPVRLQISLRNGELVKKDLEDLTNVDAPKVSAGRMFGRLESARIKLIRAPGGVSPVPFYEPNGPNPWVSDKQRRFVMMMIRRGDIKLPYRRTGGYARGWRVVKTQNGYALVNASSKAKWVSGTAYGTDQARIHQGRWPLLRDVVEESVAQLPKEIADDIVMVARRKGYQAQ
jgi:hypothetical protein